MYKLNKITKQNRKNQKNKKKWIMILLYRVIKTKQKIRNVTHSDTNKHTVFIKFFFFSPKHTN